MSRDWRNLPAQEMAVLSDDIFEKFGLEEPVLDLDLFYYNEELEKHPPRAKILRHDCMWNGQCVDKDHEKSFPMKRKFLYGRNKMAYPDEHTLLLATQLGLNNNNNNKQQNNANTINYNNNNKNRTKEELRKKKKNIYHSNFGNDGGNIFPDTPETTSCESNSSQCSDSDDDCNGLLFKHDQISINEKLTECMGNKHLLGVEIASGQQTVRNLVTEKKIVEMKVDNEEEEEDEEDEEEEEEEEEDEEEEEEEEDESESESDNDEERNTIQRKMIINKNVNSSIIQERNETGIRNTLNDDHCYYTHQPSAKKIDGLGVQTPSDSEEEIDVVTCEKPSKPAALPTYPSAAQQQVFQLTVNTALKEKSAPRPRGRPPLQGNRKRVTQEQKPVKRLKQSHPYQRKQQQQQQKIIQKNNNNNNIHLNNTQKQMIQSPIKYEILSRNVSDDEPDTDKRNLHNNMERQRRIELKDAFDRLRELIPELKMKDKAPKVAILKQASEYCKRLGDVHNAQNAEKLRLLKVQKKLKDRVSALRHSSRMSRQGLSS